MNLQTINTPAPLMLTAQTPDEYTNRNGFNLYELNAEFGDLLRKHDGDTDVTGEGRAEWLRHCKDTDSESSWTDEDKQDDREFWAMAINAFDELCSRHPGLRESGQDWSAGAEWTKYAANEYDLFVGDYERDIELPF